MNVVWFVMLIKTETAEGEEEEEETETDDDERDDVDDEDKDYDRDDEDYDSYPEVICRPTLMSQLGLDRYHAGARYPILSAAAVPIPIPIPDLPTLPILAEASRFCDRSYDCTI